MERPRRLNGLSPPYTTAQLSTWVFLPTLVLEFLFFVSPILPWEASIPCTLLFCGLAAISVYFGIRAMGTDPADPRLGDHSHIHARDDDDNNNGETEIRSWDPNEPTKQCWICDVQVGEKSMHCKFCNKCVDNFDHHCMWLNTCVGKANYPFFFRTMLSITAMLFVHFSIQTALLVDIFVDGGGTKSRSADWFQVDATIPVVAVMCVFLAFDLVALSLICQLLLFHLRLQREGLSTYQFIVQDNQRRREQIKTDNELLQKRLGAMAKAKDEGQTCHWLHLRVGGDMRKACGWTLCDPLAQAEKVKNTSISGATNGNGNGNGNGHAGAEVNGTDESQSPDQEELKEPEEP